MRHVFTKLITGLLFTGCASFAQAGLIISADAVTANTMGTAGGSTDNLFNQTGLSAGFVSGVTDFDAYIGTDPTHAVNDAGNAWAGNPGPSLGFLDFDLGETYRVNSFALWTQANPNGVNQFEILVDGVSAGLFNAALVTSAAISAQVFDVGGLMGQTVRLDVLSIHGGGNVNIGEVAFEVDDSASVPAPATLALFGLGFLGLRLRRK